MHPSHWLAASAAAVVLAASAAMPQSAQAREIVGFSENYSSGTVVVKTSERALYYVLGNGKAVRYPVGVGRAGKQWSGTAYINGKQLSELDLRDDLFDDFCLWPFHPRELEARLKHLFWRSGRSSRWART